MARESFVYDPSLKRLVPKEQFYATHGGNHRPGAGLLVIPDIQPYRSMVDGSVVGGRRQHRDHLRFHGCVEVGNEKPKQPKSIGAAPGLRGEIMRAMEQKR